MFLQNLNLRDMKNIVTFANDNQFSVLNRHQLMIDNKGNRAQGLHSEMEVKLLIADRLKRIAEGNAVTIPHDEVKNHINTLLQDEYQMA
jgi:hypothetical protein